MNANTAPTENLRIGVDLGGTKIEAVALDAHGEVRWRERVPTPKDSANAIYEAIYALVDRCESALADRATVGIGTPGSLSPKTGLVRNANSVWLNGMPFEQDLEAALEQFKLIASDLKK